ncbi:MAG: hypothetical protein ABIG84_06905 [archaeon]
MKHFDKCPRDEYDWAKDFVFTAETIGFDDIDAYFASALNCRYLKKNKKHNDRFTAYAVIYLVDFLKNNDRAVERISFYAHDDTPEVKERCCDIIKTLEIKPDKDDDYKYMNRFLSLEKSMPEEIVKRYVAEFVENSKEGVPNEILDACEKYNIPYDG